MAVLTEVSRLLLSLLFFPPLDGSCRWRWCSDPLWTPSSRTKTARPALAETLIKYKLRKTKELFAMNPHIYPGLEYCFPSLGCNVTLIFCFAVLKTLWEKLNQLGKPLLCWHGKCSCPLVWMYCIINPTNSQVNRCWSLQASLLMFHLFLASLQPRTILWVKTRTVLTAEQI